MSETTPAPTPETHPCSSGQAVGVFGPLIGDRLVLATTYDDIIDAIFPGEWPPLRSTPASLRATLHRLGVRSAHSFQQKLISIFATSGVVNEDWVLSDTTYNVECALLAEKSQAIALPRAWDEMDPPLVLVAAIFERRGIELDPQFAWIHTVSPRALVESLKAIGALTVEPL